MLKHLLPACIATEERRGDPQDAYLLPEEKHLVDDVADVRRAETTTARHCARLALVRLGAQPVPILRAPSRAPVWPAGYVGSMTHCAGFRGAAVGRTNDARSVGIDAEPDAPLPPGVLRLVTSPAERESMSGGWWKGSSGVAWDRLVFSAKEAVYKAWEPVVGRWLDFTEVDVRPRGPGQLDVDVLVPTSGAFPRRLICRWVVVDGLILTAVVVPG